VADFAQLCILVSVHIPLCVNTNYTTMWDRGPGPVPVRGRQSTGWPRTGPLPWSQRCSRALADRF